MCKERKTPPHQGFKGWNEDEEDIEAESKTKRALGGVYAVLMKKDLTMRSGHPMRAHPWI